MCKPHDFAFPESFHPSLYTTTLTSVIIIPRSAIRNREEFMRILEEAQFTREDLDVLLGAIQELRAILARQREANGSTPAIIPTTTTTDSSQ